MELGVYLSGTLTDGSVPAGWLHRTQQWLHECWAGTLLYSEIGESPNGTPLLRLKLHPAAPDVEIAARENGLVSIAAATGWPGPGYHAHLYSLVREMSAQLAVSWNLSAENAGQGEHPGHFFSADRGALERLALARLNDAAVAALRTWEEQRRPAAILLPATHEFEFDGAVATPLGPRDDTWLRAVAADPTRGTDAYPWWDEAQDAKYRLRRALSEIWTTVRWRLPATDDETAQVARVLKLLHLAHAEDPTLPYPWREWEQLRGYADHGAPVPPHSEPAAGPLAGYRRRTVRVALGGGWSISLPGSFAEQWEGDGTFWAWAEGRTVWFSARHTPEGGSDAPAESLLPDLDPGERAVGLPGLPRGFARRAGLGDLSQGGETLLKLNARLAVPGRVGLFTITYDDPAQEAWAIRTVESVRHPGAQAT